MASTRPLTPPEDPAALHAHSLSFSFTDLDTLTSTQLALVQVHPLADEEHIKRARALFVRRRMDWLEAERERVRAAEEQRARASAAARVKREDGEEGDRAGASPNASAGERAPAAVVVKREVEEISLLDDDDDDDEAMPAPLPPRPAAKRLGVVEVPASRPSPPKKRRSDLGPATTARTSAVPRRATSDTPTPSQASPKERLKAMPSFRRKGASATTPALALTPTPTPPPAPKKTVTSLKTISPRPPLPVPPPAPPPAPVADLALPIFKPNPALMIVRAGRGIQNALRTGIAPAADDWEYPYWLSPPTPFPGFAAVSGPICEEGADKPAPHGLAKRLYTVRVSGLATEVTATLLFYFFLRNQGRLRPRPLAIRTAATESLNGIPTGVWFFAFGSLDAAKLIVADNAGRKLPDMDDYQPREIQIALVRDELPAEPTFEQRLANDAQDVAVGWKWGELSDEARHAWTKHTDLPSSAVCPRFADEEVEGRPLSDEYADEVRLMELETEGDTEAVEALDRTRRAQNDVKKVLYVHSVRLWRRWMLRTPADRAAVIASGEKAPAWPVWPDDLTVLRHQAARLKAQGV
ncbi:hypothetical protein JCM10450v2_003138 [Rhodotorula kratochvilovae]